MRIFLLLLLLGLPAVAQSVRFAWNASPTPNCSNALYFSTNSLSITNWEVTAIRVPCGTNLTARITDLKPGVWNVAVAAVLGGVESPLSNILAVESPKAVINLRTIFVDYGATVTGMSNSFFFKVRFD